MDRNLFAYIWRHSRREQIFLLLVVLASLPFYFASLDLPKRIVNDVLQGHAFERGETTTRILAFDWALPGWLGGGEVLNTTGFQTSRIELLMLLSLSYLGLVLVNGALKYVVNIRKGVLGERVLRRMRFEMFSILLHFRPEELRGVRPAEAASMIKDEVEPIGGFVGDAFIQPILLGFQAATAVLFIVIQNVWLGLVAVTVVGVQAWVIPILRREQLVLGRKRQIEARLLAGRIGELVDGVPTIQSHGVVRYAASDVALRLGRLFDLRVQLFKRKFAVKFLNNLLSQVTPFFFYAIGGYLALQGRINLGELVAVLAAYRELPTPVKEIIDWDQQRLDVQVKYEQLVSQFSANRTLPEDGAAAREPDAPPLVVDSLTVRGGAGELLLDRFDFGTDRPEHIGLVGRTRSGAEALAQVIGGRISSFSGRVLICGASLHGGSQAELARISAYAGPDPFIIPGTIRDNILLSLRRAWPRTRRHLSREELRWRLEARRSGSAVHSPDDDWLDYEAAGASGPDDIDQRAMAALAAVHARDDILKLGLLSSMQAGWGAAQDIVEARREVWAGLAKVGADHLVERFDKSRYLQHASIAENVVFGAGRASPERLAAALQESAMLGPVAEIGRSLARAAVDIFGDVPEGSPLLERYGFVAPDQIPALERLLNDVSAANDRMTPAQLQEFAILGSTYMEPRHHLGLMHAGLAEGLLLARQAFRASATAEEKRDIEPYRESEPIWGATILDNLVFGRIVTDAPSADERVLQVVADTLSRLRLRDPIEARGLDFDVGVGGRHLSLGMRYAVDLARCLVKRPELFVVDGVISALGPHEGEQVLMGLRRAMRGRTLLLRVEHQSEAEGFDRVLVFSGARLVEPAEEPTSTPAARSAGGAS